MSTARAKVYGTFARKQVSGYWIVHRPEHPNAPKNGWIREHVLMAAEVLGGKLPKGAVVHHIDEDRGHNENSNFVICENKRFHNLLHARMRALAECGNANFLKCCFCHKYDAPENLRLVSRSSRPTHGREAFHRECHNKYRTHMRKRRN